MASSVELLNSSFLQSSAQWRQNMNEVTLVYGGVAIDFCGATPQHHKDAASLAIQQGKVSFCGNNGGGPYAQSALWNSENRVQHGATSTFRDSMMAC